MADTEGMAESSDEIDVTDVPAAEVDLGEIRDELPADLDPSQVTAPYLFPNNSRRKIPAVLYTLIGIGCIVLWQTAGDEAVLVNGGFGVAAFLGVGEAVEAEAALLLVGPVAGNAGDL